MHREDNFSIMSYPISIPHFQINRYYLFHISACFEPFLSRLSFNEAKVGIKNIPLMFYRNIYIYLLYIL